MSVGTRGSSGVGLGLALALALAAGCAGERPAPGTALPGTAPGDRPGDSAGGPAAEVDEALLAYLASARAYHLRADLLEEKGDLAGARAELEALLALRDGSEPAVLEAEQDAWARLARLELKAGPGRAAEAMRAVEAGLALSPEETFYRANLLLAKGEVHEVMGEVDAALDAYGQSIDINKKVLERIRLEAPE